MFCLCEMLSACFPPDVRPVPEIGRPVEQLSPAIPTPERRGFTPPKWSTVMAFSMSDSQQVNVGVRFVDRKGNPAAVDGTPEWLTDNSDLLALTPAADGKSCVVKAVGPLGTASVTMKADADASAGVRQIVGTLEVTITGGDARTVVLEPGTAEEQS